MAHLQDLMQSIRDLSDGAVWSRGVELARAETVQGVATRKGELELKVLDPKRLVPATVQFFLADGDWSCDCNSKEPACEHVAAAIIATHQARQRGRALPAAAVVNAEAESKGGEARVPARGQPAHIRYLFERTPQGLSLSRSLVQGGRVVPLEGSLATLLQSGDPLAKLAATQDDLQIDLLLGTRTQGVLGRELAAKVLAAMRRADDVRLHDDRVEVVAAITGLAAVVEDCADGLRARLEQQRGIHEIFANGIARMHKTLAPLREHGLVARDYEELRRGRIFRPHEYPELVTRLLPELEAVMPVDRRAKNLPRVEHHLPRLLLETSRDGNDLTVVPLLVYGDPPIARVDGDRLTCFGDIVPPRDLPAERRLKAMLENELGLAPGMRARYPMLQAIEATRRIQRFDAEVTGGGTDGFYVADALTPEFKVKDNGEFELRFESLVGPGNERGGRSDAAAVLQAWRNNEPLVPLLEGGFAPLPHDWLVQYGSIVTDLLAARAASAELPDASLTDLGRLCDALGEPIPRPVRIQRNALSAPLEKPKLPRGLKAKLRAYQATGVAWLQRLTKAGLGALLADDMGLGKTLQAITVLHGRTLVVAPTSVLFNWARELERFRPNLDVCLYHGPRRHLDRDADVVLTSYALLRLDQETLAAKPWDMVVLDEAQAIKNPDSQVARAAYALEAECRLALTGTPVENRLEELWSEMHFLNPGLLGTRADFEERYSKPIERGEPGIAPRLAERVRPFVLRRLKREVAPELPPRTDLVLRCELGPDERRTYDAMAAAAKKEVAERLRAGGNVLEALELLLRLRQAACHPALLPGQKAETSSKVELLLENLDEAVSEGHKALVFSQWTSFLDLVEPHLTKAKIGFTRLDGSTADRGAVVSAFQAPDGPPVLLLSLKAGGTGLNLTAADHVFMLDPWWNPAVEDQAADRAHRIGQDKPVFVHRLVAADTVEERILMLQEKKRALADSVHSGDAALKIGKEEILALFE